MIAKVQMDNLSPVAAPMVRAGFENALSEGRLVILKGGEAFAYSHARHVDAAIADGGKLATGVTFS